MSSSSEAPRNAGEPSIHPTACVEEGADLRPGTGAGGAGDPFGSLDMGLLDSIADSQKYQANWANRPAPRDR